MTELPQTCYRFGDVVFDVSNLKLTVAGGVRQLEPKSLRLLEFLIKNRHRVVPKDEILKAVWGGIAVSDNALTRAIAQIRKTLDDEPKEPRYIETVPTVGYRFAAEVKSGAEPPAAMEKVKERSSALPYRRMFAGIAVAVAVVGAGIAGAIFHRPAQQTPPVNKSVPFTTYQGREAYPSFSPDGNQIAFTWSGEHDDNFDIYVKTIGSEAPLRITTDPARDVAPQWSPDGRTIAFERTFSDGKIDVMLIAPLGGAERKLVELFSHWNEVSSQFTGDGTSWSPDGKWLAVSGNIGSKGPDRIFLVNVETGEARQLTQPPTNGLGDYSPTFAPDGASLLFVRAAVLSGGDLFRLPFNKDFTLRGEPQKVPAGGLQVATSVWASGGREILFLVAGNVLWRMPASGTGTPASMQSLGFGVGVGSLGISRDGRRLAYSVPTRDTNIWRLDLAAKNAEPERWIASTKRDVAPQYSPDGRRIAYYSNRSGIYQIWVSDADGSKAAAITSMKFAGTPRWSPDGRTIAFDSNDTGRYQVYTVSADGGKVRRVTNGATDEYTASWSRDGHWIYYASNAEGNAQIWKVSAQGGSPLQVTHNGGMSATESADGKTLYFNKAIGKGSLWKMPADGGSEQKIVDSIYRFNYAVGDKGVYLTRDGGIDFVDFATGAVRTVVKTPLPDTGLTLSPDGRYLLYAKVDSVGSDLMLVENFH